jgi:hypothetical protein
MNWGNGNQLSALRAKRFQRTIKVGALHGRADRIAGNMSIADKAIHGGHGVSTEPDYVRFLRNT